MASPPLDDQDTDMLPEDTDPDILLEDHDTDIDLLPEDKIVLRSFPKNSTMRNTRWTLSNWNNWRSALNSQLADAEKIPSVFELLSLPYSRIDKLLARFITEVKRPNGEEFPFDSVKSVVFGIQRYAKVYANLYSKQAVVFLNEEYLFPEFNKAFRLKKLYIAKHSKKTDVKKPEGVNVYKEKALWERKAFGCHTAEVFSDTIIFYLVKVFGLVSSFSLRALRIEHFVFSEDKHGKYVEIDKDYAKALVDKRDPLFMRSRGIETMSGRLRQYSDPDNPRTFYNLIMKYISEMKDAPSEDSTLLLMPRRGCFSSQPIGRNTLTKTINKVLNKANLKGYYTNLTFDQAVIHRLMASGYNAKRQKYFSIEEHLEICKILDPPIGELNIPSKSEEQTTPELTTQTQTTPPFTFQTQAIYQLSVPGNKLTTFVRQAQLPAGLANVPGNLQVLNPQNNDKLLTFNKVVLPSGVPATSVTTPGSGVTHVPATVTCSTTGQPLSATPGYIVNGAQPPSSAPSNESLLQARHHEQQNYYDPAAREALPATTHVVTETKSEPLQQDTVYPLFLSSASSRDTVAACPTDVIIKQEPVENDGTEIGNDLNKQSESTETSGHYTNQSLEIPQKYNLRKRNLVTYESDESATNDDDDVPQSSKVMRQDSSCNSENADVSGGHNVDIEFVYSHDVDKKSLKQTVSVNDDDQTVFSFTGSTRFGRPAGDLELSLGDYLPEDAYVKVSDIKLRRVTTADGGKMIFQLKYLPGT